jgi:hypothetical protein
MRTVRAIANAVANRDTVTIAAALLAAAAGCTPGPVDVATVAPNTLATGLVAHWTFDETAGATAHDSSGNLRDGAIFTTDTFGGWSWTYGQFGGGLRFTGSDQVTVGSPPFPQATASYSVAAWLRVEFGDIEPPVAAILSTESGFGGWSLNISPPPPGSPNRAVYSFAYPLATNPPNFAVAECECFEWNQWFHLAAVVDAPSASLTLYINGVERHRVAAPRPIAPHQGTLYMGRWPPGPMRQLAGILDDVAIYSRVLVPEEVGLLVAAPAPNPL